MAELRVKSTGTLKLFENDNTSSVTIASPASLGADRTVTLPDGDVTLSTGTMLATDGDGSGLSGVGKVLQVLNVEHSTESVWTTTSLAVTAYTLDITPSATSSKILINVAFPLRKGNGTTNAGMKFVLYKDGSSHRIINYWWGYYLESTAGMFSQFSSQLLDSPSTTSQVTYAIWACTNDGDDMVLNDTNATGSMTLMEIAA